MCITGGKCQISNPILKWNSIRFKLRMHSVLLERVVVGTSTSVMWRLIGFHEKYGNKEKRPNKSCPLLWRSVDQNNFFLLRSIVLYFMNYSKYPSDLCRSSNIVPPYYVVHCLVSIVLRVLFYFEFTNKLFSLFTNRLFA
jgi:hypothetical protein